MSRLLLLAGWSLFCLASVPAQASPPASHAVSDFTLHDYRGQQVSMSDFSESKLVVLAFLGTECPLAKLYAARLEEIARSYGNDQVAVIGLIANVQDNVTEMEAFARRHGITYPLLKDLGNKVADAVAARRTPEVILLDERRTIRYQGRIDDQFLVGVARKAPTREDLKSAIDELLSGQGVSLARTESIGCIIGRIREVNEASAVTYSNQISRIFQRHCVTCHREGEIGPFTLTSYDDVVGWGEMIAEVVRERRMPPWHADPRYGKFSNDCSLSDADKELVYEWVNNGCPEGDPTELPEPRAFAEGWQLPRKPDKVYEMADKPFVIPASAGPKGLDYQHFWVDPGFKEDAWIKAIEVRPGNRAVVHHVVIYLHPGGKEENFKGFGSGKEFYFLAAYVPGMLAGEPFPDGAAKKIPAGSWLRFEVHYVPNGSEQEDLSRVGMIFADPKAITHEVRTLAVINTEFLIKPRLDDQEFTAQSKPTPIDMQVLSFFPHMHLRGKSFEYEIERPGGDRETSLSVPAFDFNWQTRYVCAEPLSLPAGSHVRVRAVYDNSEKNLANPDPSATVRNGIQSWDEMMVGYVDCLFSVEESPKFPFGFL
jgi:peroxiredoxin/mono/diheme cytochrome c family protein